jgi:hypothetical protein
VTDEITVVPSVDWLEVDDHGVWAKVEPGTVIYRIDPRTNEVADEITVGDEQCQGLGVGDGSIWSCSGPDVARVDPSTNEVVARFAVGKAYSQGELAVAAGKAWLLQGDGSSIVPVDTATDMAEAPIALPWRGTDVGSGPSGVWVVSAIDDVVMHLDPQTQTIASTVELIAPTAVAVDEQDVWVVAAQETVRIDPATGEITLTVPVGGGSTGDIALTADTVWLRDTARFITRIDRDSGEVIEDANSAVYAEIAARLTSSGDIVAGFGSIWTSAYDDTRLFRISTGEPQPTA